MLKIENSKAFNWINLLSTMAIAIGSGLLYMLFDMTSEISGLRVEVAKMNKNFTSVQLANESEHKDYEKLLQRHTSEIQDHESRLHYLERIKD